MEDFPNVGDVVSLKNEVGVITDVSDLGEYVIKTRNGIINAERKDLELLSERQQLINAIRQMIEEPQN